jgi:hypothetical protein
MWTLRVKPVSVLSSLVCEQQIIFITSFGLLLPNDFHDIQHDPPQTSSQNSTEQHPLVL